MKVCPICQSRFQESGVFCPHDGTRLVDIQVQAPGDLSQTTLNEVATLTQREYVDRIIHQYDAKLVVNAQKISVTIFQKESRPSPHRASRLQEIISQLGAPLPKSILTVHSFDLDFEPAYLIESAPEGKSLAKILREQKKLDWQTALRLICNIGRTLDWAATQKIFHRALTPDQIYVSDLQAGSIQIGGWLQAEALLVDSALNASETNQFHGYAQYLAPEVAVNSANFDPRALIYTLSLIAFELITGAPPLVGTTDAETIAKHLHEKPTPISQAIPDAQFPDTLDDILRLMWAKSPNQRFQAIPAAIAALSSLLDADPWTVAPAIERADKPTFPNQTNVATIAMTAFTLPPDSSPKPIPNKDSSPDPSNNASNNSSNNPDENFDQSQTALGMPAQDFDEPKPTTEPFPAVFDPQEQKQEQEAAPSTNPPEQKTLLLNAINFSELVSSEAANQPDATEPEPAQPEPAQPAAEIPPLLAGNLDLSEFSTSSTPFDDEESDISADFSTDSTELDSQDLATAVATPQKTSSRRASKKSKSKSKTRSKMEPFQAIETPTAQPATAQPEADATEQRTSQKEIKTQRLPNISTDLPKPSAEELSAKSKTSESSQKPDKTDRPNIGVLTSNRPTSASSDTGDDWFGMSTEDAWEDSLAQEARERSKRTERTLFISFFIILIIGTAATYAYFKYSANAQAEADAQAQAQLEAARSAEPAVNMTELRRGFDDAVKSKILLLPRSESALGFLEKMQRHDTSHPEFLEARAIFVQETFSQSKYEEEAGNLKKARDHAGYATQFDPEDTDLKDWAEQLHARLIADSPTSNLFADPNAPPTTPEPEPTPEPTEENKETTPKPAPEKATNTKAPTKADPAPKTPTPATPPKNDAPTATTLIEQARKAYSRNDLAEAQKLYNQANTLAPNNPTIHAGLGQVYFEQAQHDKALQHQKRAVELRPNQTSYRIQLGMVYYRLTRYQEAISTWNEVLKQDPNNDVAKRYIALAQGKID